MILPKGQGFSWFHRQSKVHQDWAFQCGTQLGWVWLSNILQQRFKGSCLVKWQIWKVQLPVVLVVSSDIWWLFLLDLLLALVLYLIFNLWAIDTKAPGWGCPMELESYLVRHTNSKGLFLGTFQLGLIGSWISGRFPQGLWISEYKGEVSSSPSIQEAVVMTILKTHSV